MTNDPASLPPLEEEPLGCFRCPICGVVTYAFEAPFCERHGLRVRMRPCSDAENSASQQSSDSSGDGDKVAGHSQGGSQADPGQENVDDGDRGRGTTVEARVEEETK